MGRLKLCLFSGWRARREGARAPLAAVGRAKEEGDREPRARALWFCLAREGKERWKRLASRGRETGTEGSLLLCRARREKGSVWVPLRWRATRRGDASGSSRAGSRRGEGKSKGEREPIAGLSRGRESGLWLLAQMGNRAEETREASARLSDPRVSPAHGDEVQPRALERSVS